MEVYTISDLEATHSIHTISDLDLEVYTISDLELYTISDLDLDGIHVCSQFHELLGDNTRRRT